MSLSCEAQGTLYRIDETKSYGANNFEKREFILLLTGEGENAAYPNYLPLSFTKDKCSILDTYSLNQAVKVTFNVGGRLWNPGDGKPEKAFADLGAWKIESLGDAQAEPVAQAASADDENLPF